MGNYILRNMKYGNEVVGIMETYEEFRATYKANHMPKYLTIEYKQSGVKVQIQYQCIKMYVTKEMEMYNNIESVYANIRGKCTDPLHNMINHLKQFTLKHKGKDAIWPLNNLGSLYRDRPPRQ